MGIPDHLTCLLRNLYAGQDATVRTGHETIDWFQIGKGVRQHMSEPLNILKAGQHEDYRIAALGQGHWGWGIWVEVLVHRIVLRLIT